MTKLTEHERDQRDLTILGLIGKHGMTQRGAAERMGITRGPVSRLVADIRKDEST